MLIQNLNNKQSHVRECLRGFIQGLGASVSGFSATRAGLALCMVVSWGGTSPAALAVEAEQNLPCRLSQYKGPRFTKLTTVQRQTTGSSSQYLVSWDSEQHQEESDDGSWLEKPQSGARFEIARCLASGRWAIVGQGIAGGRSGRLVDGVATAVNDRPAANVLEESALAQSGNFYWRPMVGDAVMPVHAHIGHTMRVTPKLRYALAELFERNANGSFSYDLSEEGRQRLRENFKVFGAVKGRVMIEGVAQIPGRRSELRLQSQVRAKAVAQFLARDFEIESEKLVAVGYGSEGMPSGFAPVAQWPELDMSESITLRVMPR